MRPMSMIEFVPASRFEPVRLAELFTRGYEGYYVPMTLTAEAYADMVRWFDLDLEASRVALAGGVPVGIVQLGVRGSRGWIGGMGVVPEARGRGLGRALMDEAERSARALGLRTVDLEVLVQNVQAIPIYEACGYRHTRRLLVLERAPAPLAAEAAAERPALDEVFERWDALHAVPAPWQRGRETVERLRDVLEAFGVRERGRLVASVLVARRPARSNVIALGFEAGADPGALDRAIAAAVAAHADRPQMLLNLPAGQAGEAALRRAGFESHLEQFEMELALGPAPRVR